MSSLSRQNGGLYDSVRRLHQTLAQLTGIESSVWGIRDKFTDEDRAGWSPVPTYAFPVVGWKKFAYAPELRRSLLEFAPDVVHTQGIWEYPSRVVSAWHRKYRRPYLISPHGMLDPWAVKNSAWKKRLAWVAYEREQFKHAAVIRALCESEAKAIRAFGLKNPVCIIPNGIDPIAFNGNLASEKLDSTLNSVARDRRILLYLGRIHPKKGLGSLLRAWKKAQDSTTASRDWMMAIAGWDQGGHEGELRKCATELGLEDSVAFLGPQFGAEKIKCYSSCDAFILPSVSEGLPMVVLEAWAYGKPVLMTPACNLPEGYVAGAAVEIGPDPLGLAAGLGILFEMTDAERKAMGQRGLKLVQAQFAWPKIGAEMKSVYEWMLGGPRPDSVWIS